VGQQLALDEATSIFTASGELIPEVVAQSRMIIPSAELNNPAIPAGFAKYTTPTFRSPSGPFQMHFYLNPSTGEPFFLLDFKAVFNNGISPFKLGGL